MKPFSRWSLILVCFAMSYFFVQVWNYRKGINGEWVVHVMVKNYRNEADRGPTPKISCKSDDDHWCYVEAVE